MKIRNAKMLEGCGSWANTTLGIALIADNEDVCHPINVRYDVCWSSDDVENVVVVSGFVATVCGYAAVSIIHEANTSVDNFLLYMSFSLNGVYYFCSEKLVDPDRKLFDRNKVVELVNRHVSWIVANEKEVKSFMEMS